jgi:hypothetical protein
MIIVIATQSKDKKTGIIKLITSHGVDHLTLQNIVLPPVHPRELGAEFWTSIGEWVIT